MTPHYLLFVLLPALREIIVCIFHGWLFRLRRWLGLHTYSLHDLSDSLDPTRITYSQVWEDTRPLRQALHIKAGENVLCVASGGDNAFSLLLDRPGSVLAVDYSNAQILLCRLKQAAIKHLSYEQFVCLLGLGPSHFNALSRNAVYQQCLRQHLEEDVLRFWDEAPQQESIRGGLLHCGRYEQYFRTFAHAIRPLVHSDSTTRAMLSIREPQQQKDFYDKVWDTRLWRMMVRLYMGDVLIGRCPPFYQRSDMDIGEHFLQRMRHCLRDLPIGDNFYMEYVLTGEHSNLTSLPDYLQQEKFAGMKERIDSVHFLQGEVLKHMEAAAVEGLHVADLSNIFDFVPEEQHDHYRRAVMKHMSPGSRICHWTFVPMTHGKLQAINIPFSCQTHIDSERCASYNLQERAWFYQTFVLQEVEQEAAAASQQKNGYVKARSTGMKHRAAAGEKQQVLSAGANTISIANGHSKLEGDVCNGHGIS